MMRSGALSPAALVEALLARIDALEPTVKAWVTIDRAQALRLAEEMSEETRAGTFRGPLHGIPVGIKDIVHVAGVLTTAGAGRFAHVVPFEDAASVARLRAAGAIVLGKTTTTEFAYLDATVTTNPWNPGHTPGGSSAGSAAAVSAGMIPVALGSQTIGSTLRPAAYCGIVGFKPTHGRISLDGVHPLAPTLDHVGIFCRSVDDAALLFAVLADDPAQGTGPPAGPQTPPRIGVLGDFFVTRTEAGSRAVITGAVNALAAAGAQIVDVALPVNFTDVYDATNLIVEVEAASVHRARFAEHGTHYRPKLRTLVEQGQQRSAAAYTGALDLRRRFREEMTQAAARVDALLMATTPAPAPRGLESTGDPTFCAPWSFAGFPAISLPAGLSGGLPVGIQLVAGLNAEAQLLAAAHWCERIIAFSATPDRAGRLTIPQQMV
jgi:Asp-tRNA(Asn)/Glu-tRNA(Gln) amidotransferase A subunit family amidase